MFAGRWNANYVTSVLKRQVHTCSVYNDAVGKQSKILSKIMTGSHRKKKNWSNLEFMAKAPILPSNKSFQQGSRTRRRIDVLNKLFMRSITDILATGEVVPELIGHGISITKVKVAPDFKVVNVFWTAKGTLRTAELDKIMENAGFQLRHELCQLHIMGNIPHICFVADKWQYIVEDTLRYLDLAKLQSGYSEDPAESLKSEYILELPLDSEILDKMENIEENHDDNPLPSMTHNVLGLDHAAIMSKIQASVVKSEARHRQNIYEENDYNVNSDYNTRQTDSENHGITPTDISKYIAKQRIIKKKAEKALRKELQANSEFNDEPSGIEEYIDIEDGDFVEDFEDKMGREVEIQEK